MIVLGMANQEDFHRPEQPLENTWEIDNKARISKKAKMKGKFNRNQKCITLWDITKLSNILDVINHTAHYIVAMESWIAIAWQRKCPN